jgi:hypothetical protein
MTQNRLTLTIFGFALMVVGIAVFVMGPQSQSLTFVAEHGVWNAPSAILFLFCGGGVAFVLGSVFYKRNSI